MKFSVDFAHVEDIPKMIQLDAQVFNENVLVENSRVFDWFSKNQYQWLIAKDQEDNLIGYISIWHINKDTFNKLINGEITESEIKSSDIVSFGKENEIYCNIGVFVSKDKNTRVAISLINKFLKYVRFLSENNIIIKKISTVPVSSIGHKLSEKLGFEKVGETKPLCDGSVEDIYVLDLQKQNFSHIVNEIKDIFLENDKYFK